jgi:flagellar hook-basal body complex protein FliE
MTIYRPELVNGDKVPMAVTHPKHLLPLKGGFTLPQTGGGITELENKIGAEAVLRSGTFEDTMLRALDQVSAQQQFSDQLAQAAVVDPGSVDIHDITIAQAKAGMSLNIARTVLSRVVQGWKDLINIR